MYAFKIACCPLIFIFRLRFPPGVSIAAIFKAQYHLLSDVILRLRNNITVMYFDRYLSCFGIKIQIILVNLYKLKIEY